MSLQQRDVLLRKRPQRLHSSLGYQTPTRSRQRTVRGEQFASHHSKRVVATLWTRGAVGSGRLPHCALVAGPGLLSSVNQVVPVIGHPRTPYSFRPETLLLLGPVPASLRRPSPLHLVTSPPCQPSPPLLLVSPLRVSPSAVAVAHCLIFIFTSSAVPPPVSPCHPLTRSPCQPSPPFHPFLRKYGHPSPTTCWGGGTLQLGGQSDGGLGGWPARPITRWGDSPRTGRQSDGDRERSREVLLLLPFVPEGRCEFSPGFQAGDLAAQGVTSLSVVV